MMKSCQIANTAQTFQACMFNFSVDCGISHSDLFLPMHGTQSGDLRLRYFDRVPHSPSLVALQI